MALERFLAVWCPDLALESEDGSEARAFERVVGAVGELAASVDIVRPGLCAALTRGPSRYFGGDHALAELIAARVAGVFPGRGAGGGAGGCGEGVGAGIGVADGLFAATLAARRGAGSGQEVHVAPGGTAAFLSAWSVTVLERHELTDVLVRLGVATLGAFAALPEASVFARFGADGAVCHAVAGGRRSELPGLRASVTGTGPDAAALAVRQPAFWGGAAGGDERAAEALHRLQGLLGPEAVVVGRIQGGRGPGDRARLVPFGPGVVPDGAGRAKRTLPPWPGQLPAPAPAMVLARPLPALVDDRSGEPVEVSARGALSAAPDRVSVCGGAWAAVAGWAGPWPADERWWSPSHTRRARMQVVVESGAACLLVRERGSWWLEGFYD